MDANGHRFWMIADAAQIDLAPGGLVWDAAGCHLRLAGRADALATPTPRSAALAMADAPPTAIDGYGGIARVAADGRRILAGAAALPGAAAAAGADPSVLATLTEGAQIRDLCLDADGVLRLAARAAPGAEGMVLIDLRGRWTLPLTLPTPGASPDRVAAAAGHVWLLERATGRVWRERGTPLPDLARRAPTRAIFRPDPEQASPPRLVEQPPLALAAGERIACMAAGPRGDLAVLVLDIAQRPQARVILRAPDGGADRSLAIPQRGFPGQIGWVAADRLALLYPQAPRAVVLALGATLTPVADRHPLPQPGDGLRLARGDALPCATVGPDGRPRPLRALSLPGYGTTGRARARIDGLEPGLVWHRLVVEGDFPPGCGATVTLRAADDPDALADAPAAPHLIADAPHPTPEPSPGVAAPGDPDPGDPDPGASSPGDPGGDPRPGPATLPRAAWLVEPSELPFHPGLMGAAPIPDRRGVFSVLIQRTGTVTRALAGRHLALDITLHGNGQATPRLVAVRAWGGRFSLTRAYLPPVFHAPDDPALAQTPGPAHPRDFAERFTALFEDMLTRIEDKVAAAPLVTHPMAAPEPALDWLAGWIGVELPGALPLAARRAMVTQGLALHRARGTLRGLLMALDLASGGGVGRGEIVAVEDHRLTRVFATVLGADPGAAFDPLLAGPVESGNSRVGPGLFLTEAAGPHAGLDPAQTAELAALLGLPDEAAAARAFLGRLAHRVTVLVHAAPGTRDLGLITAMARDMTPAHVALRVVQASHPLILGLTSLLGIETHLRPRPRPGPTVIDQSRLGDQDLLTGPPGFPPTPIPGPRP